MENLKSIANVYNSGIAKGIESLPDRKNTAEWIPIAKQILELQKQSMDCDIKNIEQSFVKGDLKFSEEYKANKEQQIIPNMDGQVKESEKSSLETEKEAEIKTVSQEIPVKQSNYLESVIQMDKAMDRQNVEQGTRELEVVRRFPKNRETTSELPVYVDPMVDEQSIEDIAKLFKKKIVRKAILTILKKRRQEEQKKSGKAFHEEKLLPYHYSDSGEIFKNILRRYLKPEEIKRFARIDSKQNEYYTIQDYISRMEEIAALPGRYREITRIEYDPKKKAEESVKLYEGVTSSGIVIKKMGIFIPDKPYEILSNIYTLTLALQLLKEKKSSIFLNEIEKSELEKHVPTLAKLTEAELVLEYVREKFPKEYEAINESKSQRMFRQGTWMVNPVTGKRELTNTMPLNIVADYVRMYFPNEHSYAFISVVVDWVLYISAPDEAQEEMYNVLTFEHIPDSWFENAVIHDSVNASLIKGKQTKYIKQICEWIIKAFGKYDNWCDVNLRLSRKLSNEEYIPFMPELFQDESKPTDSSPAESKSSESKAMDSISKIVVQDDLVEIYPNLVLLPSIACNMRPSLLMAPNLEKGILSLPPKEKNHSFAFDTKLSFFSRLNEVLKQEKKVDYQVVESQNEEAFKSFINSFWDRFYPIYDIHGVIAEYLIKVKNIPAGKEEFAKNVNDTYSRFMEKEGKKPKIFTPMPSDYFPADSKGNDFYMMHLTILGYIPESGYKPYEEKLKVSRAQLEELQREIDSMFEIEDQWKMIPKQVKAFDDMNVRIENFRDLVRRNIKKNESKIGESLVNQAIQNVNDPKTSLIDIVHFTVACFPIGDTEQSGKILPPPLIGKDIPNNVESFKKVAQILNSDTVFEKDKTIFNKRFIDQLNRVIGDFNPEMVNKIPASYFFVSESDPNFYSEYTKSYEDSVKKYKSQVERDLSNIQSSDVIQRLQKLLNISRM